MRKKRKGFTLVELLVVIAIIALLMGILMPALARVRALAFRVVCGTNLSGLGKAMLIYANDYDDELPKAGAVNSVWVANLPVWNGANRFIAYGLDGNGRGGRVTVSSHFYLLVKYAEVGPKQFLCKGTDTSEFKLPTNVPYDLIDVWDFGPGLDPIKHCSYSYHAAINSPFALTTASTQPGMAVAADRNPWLDPVGSQTNRPGFKPDIAPWNGTSEEAKAGNAYAHGGEGQNVLFMDSHVAFEKRAYCGVQDDNIYTFCDNPLQPQLGVRPTNGGAVPLHKEDSLLVNEGQGVPGPIPDPTPDPDPIPIPIPPQ